MTQTVAAVRSTMDDHDHEDLREDLHHPSTMMCMEMGMQTMIELRIKYVVEVVVVMVADEDVEEDMMIVTMVMMRCIPWR